MGKEKDDKNKIEIVSAGAEPGTGGGPVKREESREQQRNEQYNQYVGDAKGKLPVKLCQSIYHRRLYLYSWTDSDGAVFKQRHGKGRSCCVYDNQSCFCQRCADGIKYISADYDMGRCGKLSADYRLCKQRGSACD